MISGGRHNLAVVSLGVGPSRHLIDLSAVAGESLVMNSELIMCLSYARHLLVITKRVAHILQDVSGSVRV